MKLLKVESVDANGKVIEKAYIEFVGHGVPIELMDGTVKIYLTLYETLDE